MESPKVTIQIVTWNSLKYMSECIDSILTQTYRDFQILVIDNNSQDGTVKFLKVNYPEVTVFQNNKNIGFARANNQGIKLLNSPYVVVCNPDIILEPDWLAKMMTQVENERHDRVGSFGGKVLKMRIIDSELNEIEKMDVIDTCGLKFLKSHRFVELGAGESSSSITQDQEVFGQSGALTLYRRTALNDALVITKDRPQGEYFDEDFFFYKEDVDLAWRLQLLGWHSLLVSEAIAYHARTMSGSEKNTAWQVMKNKRRQSGFAKYHSYRNHLFVLLKNEFGVNISKFWPMMFWYELKKFIYVVFFEFYNLKAWWNFFGSVPMLRRKRKIIFSRAKVGPAYIRKWIQ